MGQAIILIGGPGGTGKTTTSRKLASLLDNASHLSFFSTTMKEGYRLNISESEMVRQWCSLQRYAFENTFAPLINKGQTLILDTHYQMQNSEDPRIVFAKRSISMNPSFKDSHGDEFLQLIGATKIPIYLFLINTDVGIILERIRNDGVQTNRVYATTLNEIQVDLQKEHEFYERMVERLRRMSIPITNAIVDNSGQSNEGAALSILKKLQRG
ncbi:MAG: hypothetical protein KGH71_04450 [Candidatus Micrarchaeota archaeon]|nr:hypothetical protein [Candidatus Micrarchaeota archaeon]